MPKPLRSTQVTAPPPDVQFKHFGVLELRPAEQGLAVYVGHAQRIVLAIIALIIGAAAKKTIDDRAKLRT